MAPEELGALVVCESEGHVRFVHADGPSKPSFIHQPTLNDWFTSLFFATSHPAR